MTARRVLFGRERFTAELDWAVLMRLLPGWEVVVSPPDQIADHLDGVAAICPFGAWVDRTVLDAGSFGLVHQYGVGLEKVDIARATELGVWVSRVPGNASGNAESVADLAVLFLLALTRRLDEARAALAGLLGLLAGADAVICCAMFDGGNAGMFGAEAFAAMRPGALFVNVARGGLVDEAALLAALQAGHVGGAGLDVHAREPADPDSALLRHPAVIATPHVGGLTTVMFRRTGRVFAANLRRWADGGTPRWAVNAPGFCRWPRLP